MCDNGFKSLGSPKIFDGLRYRKWMREVWESFKVARLDFLGLIPPNFEH